MAYASKELKNQRQREWNARNREKVREQRRRWFEKNREKMREYDRSYHKRIRRYKRRAKTKGTKRCAFCQILLASKSVRMKQRKYCDGCSKNPSIRRYLHNLYHRRWRQKKIGSEQESLTIAEDTI